MYLASSGQYHAREIRPFSCCGVFDSLACRSVFQCAAPSRCAGQRCCSWMLTSSRGYSPSQACGNQPGLGARVCASLWRSPLAALIGLEMRLSDGAPPVLEQLSRGWGSLGCPPGWPGVLEPLGPPMAWCHARIILSLSAQVEKVREHCSRHQARNYVLLLLLLSHVSRVRLCATP